MKSIAKTAHMNAINHLESDECYSPSSIVEFARDVMGGIDIDPASCSLAQYTVMAKRYFSREDDGLSQEWHGSVWLNPPYSKNSKSVWLNKLLDEQVDRYCFCVSHDFTSRAVRDSVRASEFVVVVYPEPLFVWPDGSETKGFFTTMLVFGGDVDISRALTSKYLGE